MIAHETNMFFLRYKATQITTNNSNRCVNVQQNKTKKKGGGHAVVLYVQARLK